MEESLVHDSNQQVEICIRQTKYVGSKRDLIGLCPGQRFLGLLNIMYDLCGKQDIVFMNTELRMPDFNKNCFATLELKFIQGIRSRYPDSWGSTVCRFRPF